MEKMQVLQDKKCIQKYIEKKEIEATGNLFLNKIISFYVFTYQ